MENWKTVRLGDVCEILNGYAFKSDKYVDSGIRVIRITNVQKGFIEDNSPAFYPITEKENLKDYELYENDLLISLTGNVGRVALLSKEMLPAALNQRVGCIRIRDKNLLISYLFTFLNSDKFESDCIYSARGIAQKNMSTEWLKNYLIPLPPIEVQIKIANNLNTCAKIIKKHNKQLNNFDLLIKSRFIEMFGDPVQNPKEWDIKKLSDYMIFLTSGSRGWSEYFSNEGELFLTIKNVKNNRINIENIQYVQAPKNKEAERTKVQENDLLISITADLGRTGVVSKEIANYGAYINQHLSLVRLNTEKVNPLFVSYYLETDGGKLQFNKKNQSAVKAGLNFEAIKSLTFMNPPLKKQNEFVAFVQQIDKSKFAVQKSLEKAETLYKSLMQEYFG